MFKRIFQFLLSTIEIILLVQKVLIIEKDMLTTCCRSVARQFDEMDLKFYMQYFFFKAAIMITQDHASRVD